MVALDQFNINHPTLWSVILDWTTHFTGLETVLEPVLRVLESISNAKAQLIIFFGPSGQPAKKKMGLGWVAPVENSHSINIRPTIFILYLISSKQFSQVKREEENKIWWKDRNCRSWPSPTSPVWTTFAPFLQRLIDKTDPFHSFQCRSGTCVGDGLKPGCWMSVVLQPFRRVHVNLSVAS